MSTEATFLIGLRQRHKLADDAPVRIKALPAEIAEDSGDPHKFTARITTAALDRDDEALLPSGMDPSEFDASGTVFWNHDYDKPVAVPGKPRQHDGQVGCPATFLKRPADWKDGPWFPDFVRAFVQQMNAAGKSVGVSVGFLPVEARKPSKKDRETWGDRVKSVVSKWKLLEWSIAPVQANPEAVITAVGKSLDRVAFKALFPTLPLPAHEIMVDAPQREAATVVKAAQSPRIIIVMPQIKRVQAVTAKRPAFDPVAVAAHQASRQVAKRLGRLAH